MPTLPLPPLEEIISRHGLQADKRLGQHFLTDRALLARIVAYAGVDENTHVIEIGSGPGGLTRALLEHGVASLSAVELDERCLRALEEIRALDGRLRIVHGDGLAYAPQALAAHAPRALVANLPYNVGTAIIMHYLRSIEREGAGAVTSMTVMLQQEVAQRMAAPAGDGQYGRLSVLCQWLCEVEICFDVPPEAFRPPPKVMSSVVRLAPRAEPAFAASLPSLERLLAAAFGQRRKMLRGSLKGWHPQATALLEAAGIDPTRRAETLTLQEIGRLLAPSEGAGASA